MQTIAYLFHITPYPVLLLIGICLRLWIGKRRFDRRSPGGIQLFPGYYTAIITLFIEFLLKRAAFVLMLCGIYRCLSK